jgi:hypothetical protein
MNLPTLFVSLLPAALLGVVLLDRLVWPLLSRLISPFSRFKLVTNRKALITIGLFSLAVALNGLQAIKDHLK